MSRCGPSAVGRGAYGEIEEYGSRAGGVDHRGYSGREEGKGVGGSTMYVGEGI